MTDSLTARCARCGRELPATYWSTSGLCASCAADRAPISGTVLPPETDVPQPRRAQPAKRITLSPTTVLVGLNVLVFVAMVARGLSPVSPSASQLLSWGADWGPFSLGAQPWRMLVSNYLHFGIIHIFFNMWCLWNLGLLMERLVDGWTYVLAYTACGIGGSIASLAWHPMVIGAGASGAIFGLAGLMITIFYLGDLPIPKAAIKPTLKSLISFAGYNLLFGLVPGIDNSAHLGGLITGLLLGAVIARTVTAPKATRVASCWIIFIVTAAVLAGGTTLVRKQHSDVQTIGQGLSKLDAGDYKAGVDDFRSLPRSNPNSPETQLMGNVYLLTHTPDQAIQTFQSALKAAPSVDVEIALYLAYHEKGMEQEANDAMQKAQDMQHLNP